jgi:hypothetical protein
MKKRSNEQEQKKVQTAKTEAKFPLAVRGTRRRSDYHCHVFPCHRDGGGTPSIAVDQQKIEYGDVKFGVEKSFAIRVTNTGDGTLRFKEAPYIEVLEGC